MNTCLPKNETPKPEPDSVATPRETLEEMLKVSGRGYTLVRTVFCQRPRGAEDRSGVLAKFVAERKLLPLQLYLLLLTVEPWARDRKASLPGQVWARAVNAGGRNASPSDVSVAWGYLEQQNLITRTKLAHGVKIRPLDESGDGTRYTSPNRHYFSLPAALWTENHFDTLGLSGLAMLLVIASQTNSRDREEVWLSNEHASEWWGLSPRTSRKGIEKLREHGLLASRTAYVKAPLAPSGVTQRVTYRLEGDYATSARLKAQSAAGAARATRLQKTSGGAPA